MLAILTDAYHVEDVRGEKRVVLRFHPEVAPVKIAVLPLLKKREEIVARCGEIRDRLAARGFATVYDDTAAIGRLYRRQDEVGTPYCVTVDVQTVGDPDKGETGDGRVTIRDRDSMGQVRVPIARARGGLRRAPRRDAVGHRRRAVPRAVRRERLARAGSPVASRPAGESPARRSADAIPKEPA